MKRQRPKELKQPLWQELIYLILLVGVPVLVTCFELFKSKVTMFTWSFASVGTILITLGIIKKFIIKGKLDAIKVEIASLKHDYSIEVGNPELAKSKWQRLNLFLYLYNAFLLFLSAVLLALFVTAIADGLMAFKGAAIAILCSTTIALAFKSATFINFRRS